MSQRVKAKLLSIGRAAVLSGALGLLGNWAIPGPPVWAENIPEPLATDAMLQAMLAKPASIDTALQYAVATRDLGDIEASIGALERLLFYNPNLARVRFELGTLYFRLGSYQMARGYFETVLSAADATTEMKERAQEYIDEIEKKLDPNQWSGYFQTGFRYQTNASFGPSQQSLLGATRPINSPFTPQADWNWFAAFALNYVHDFENQSGDVFEANIRGYTAQQFNVTEVSTGLLDIRIGPRFGVLLDTLKGASFKPYAVATGVLLANQPYLGSFGAGMTMHFNWANAGWDPYIEIRRMDYRSSSLYPLAFGLEGILATAALQGTGSITTDVRWQGRLTYSHADDRFPWYSYDRFAFDFWLPVKVPAPWGGRNWVLTPSFTVSPWLYRQPDPAIVPLVTERAFEWRVGAGLDIPIWDRFGLGIAVQYRAYNSNVPGNTIRDLAVTMGPAVSF
ncbi:MAG: tetratricopeptide repeat protein [Beijerinckiaceae bacterium]|nr:tetratricopeptide repeat protein [Beijerinckiaceae bacterium]